MHDAHFHWSQELSSVRLPAGIVNAASPEEFSFLKEQQEQYGYYISAGIHPWFADQYDYSEFKPFLEQADFIGEIGMDNVWCQVAYKTQKEQFLRQLSFACACQKPVILHTKGREAEILRYIKEFPNTYQVHWYSCMDYLEAYIELDCYFSVGISVGNDPAVNQVAIKVPENRLLLETDGIDAISWAFHQKKNEIKYAESLKNSTKEIARQRGWTSSCDELEARLDYNFKAFTHLKDRQLP